MENFGVIETQEAEDAEDYIPDTDSDVEKVDTDKKSADEAGKNK